MQLFELASRHRAWLAQNQTVVAENISNANTPGYKARRTEEFADLLESRSVQLAATQQGHIVPTDQSSGRFEVSETAEVATHSGNTVDIDSEFLRAGEIRGGYALNTSIVKTFNRLLQASVRS